MFQVAFLRFVAPLSHSSLSSLSLFLPLSKQADQPLFSTSRKARAATTTMSNLPGRTLSVVGGAGGAVIGGGAHLVGGVGKAGFQGVTTVGKGVGTGVGAVGKGVFGVGRKLVGGGHGRKDSAGVGLLDGDVPSPAPSGSGGATPTGYAVSSSSPILGGGEGQLEVLAGGSPNPNGAGGAGGRSGTLTVTVNQLINAGEAGDKRSVAVLYNGKKIVETSSHKGADSNVLDFGSDGTKAAVIKLQGGENESAALEFSVHVHKAFSSHKHVASASVPSIWQYVGPTQQTAQVNLALGGGNLLATLEVRPFSAFLSPPLY